MLGEFAYIAARCMLVKWLLTNMLCGLGKIEILSSCTKLVCCLARSLNARSLRQQKNLNAPMTQSCHRPACIAVNLPIMFCITWSISNVLPRWRPGFENNKDKCCKSELSVICYWKSTTSENIQFDEAGFQRICTKYANLDLRKNRQRASSLHNNPVEYNIRNRQWLTACLRK